MGSTDSWSRVAVFGAGAVGCYFGGMLARSGTAVTLIGRRANVEAITAGGLLIESAAFRERVPIAASERADAAREAQIVLVCVKTIDTEDAARQLAPHLAPGAIVVSLQNGVDNVERMRAAAGIDAIPAVVYVAVEMAGPGHVRHSGRGDLEIGDPAGRDQPDNGRRRELDTVAALFARAGVPFRISENIAVALWTKLLINCAYNALSAIGRVPYGRMVLDAGVRDLMTQIVAECVAVAGAAGVALSEPALQEATLRLAHAMPEAVSSTAQDLARGRRTEIDSLNGYVARRGAALGVATPVNRTLHALVTLLSSAPSAFSAPLRE